MRRKPLLVILLVGLALRIGVVMLAEIRPAQFDFPDSHRYVRVARNIAAGLGPIDHPPEPGALPTVYSGTDPLYPAMLSAAVRLGFDQDAEILRFGRMLNVLFGLGAVWLIFVLVLRLFDRRTAYVAAMLMAIDPIMLYFTALVLTEACYMFWLMLGLACCVRVWQGGPLAWAAIGGGALGAGTLARSSGILFPIFLAAISAVLCLVRCGRNAVAPSTDRLRDAAQPTRVGRGFAAIAVFIAVSIVVLLPTTVRNYQLSGRWAPVRTGGGAGLMEGLGPWADGSPGMNRIQYSPFPEGADEFERDAINRRAAIRWVRDNSCRAIKLAWAKLARTWSITINADAYQNSAYRMIAWGSVAPVFAFAVVGMGVLRRRRWVLVLLLTPAIYFTLLHMVFVGSVRYRVPAMPGVFVLASVGMLSLWDLAVTRRRKAA